MIKTFGSVSALMIVIAISIVTSSCNEDAAFDVNGHLILTSKNWKLNAFRMGMEYKVLLTNFKVEIDALDSARDCELEDVIDFHSDSSYQIMDQGLLCDETPASGIREEGTWYLSPDQRNLTIDLLRNQNYLKDLKELDIENTTFRVLELKESFFKLELRLDEDIQNAPFGLPDDYEIIITLELTAESI